MQGSLPRPDEQKKPEPRIELVGVTKRYGRFTAVSDLNLSVSAGEIMGFLGPNGAGKTTTIRLLTGFLRPSAGTVRLLGQNLNQERGRGIRERLGFVPDVAGVDLSATGRWLLDELATLQRRPPVDRETLMAALELTGRDLKRPMGRLSRGTRQKINIVQGLQHRPELIILDEPAEGLDPLTKRALFRVLRAARERGATLFFSSHILSEVEDLCDRVALIRNGRLVAVEALAGLSAGLQRRVSVHVNGESEAEAERQLRALAGISNLRSDNGIWHFQTGQFDALLAVLSSLPVDDLIVEPPSLEDIILRYYHDGEDDPEDGGRG